MSASSSAVFIDRINPNVVHIPAPDNVLADDELVAVASGVRIWRATHQHLVQQDADGPIIRGFIVAFAQNQFGRHVLRCATQRVRAAFCLLGESEVDKLAVAGVVYENVLRLQVTVQVPRCAELQK